MSDASPRPLLLITAGLAIAVAVTGIMVWQAHGASARTERLLCVREQVERIGVLSSALQTAGGVRVIELVQSGLRGRFLEAARPCFETMRGSAGADIGLEIGGLQLPQPPPSLAALMGYLATAECDVPELGAEQMRGLLDQLRVDDKLSALGMRARVRWDNETNAWQAQVRVRASADDIKTLSNKKSLEGTTLAGPPIRVEIDEAASEFHVQGRLDGTSVMLCSVWDRLLSDEGAAARPDPSAPWAPKDDTPIWASIETLSPSQAQAWIEAELRGANQTSTVAAIASYVVPLAAAIGLGSLIALVAGFVLRVHRWSDRVNDPIDRWMRWVWVSVVLGCTTVWLPAALGGGWHQIRATEGAMPVLLASGLLLVPTAVLAWLVVRLQFTLRRNRREG